MDNLVAAEHKLLVIKAVGRYKSLFFWCADETFWDTFAILVLDIPRQEDRDEAVLTLYCTLPEVVELTRYTICGALDEYGCTSGVGNALKETVEVVLGGALGPEG
jgi:hypothetical protein